MKHAIPAFERIERLYELSPEEHSFLWYVQLHHRIGFVFSRPDYFIMGRPVVKDASPRLITEPTYRFDWAQCDCWFIHAMAGNMAKAWEILPWDLPWLAWERERSGENDLCFHRTDTIRRLSGITVSTA